MEPQFGRQLAGSKPVRFPAAPQSEGPVPPECSKGSGRSNGEPKRAVVAAGFEVDFVERRDVVLHRFDEPESLQPGELPGVSRARSREAADPVADFGHR